MKKGPAVSKFLDDPDYLGRELADAYRHIEWLVTHGAGSSSNAFGVRLNAKEFVSRPIVVQVLTRWPTPDKDR